MAASVLVVALSAALLAAPASAAGDPAVYQGQATRLYAAYFLRDPDPSGLQFWIGRLDAGSSLFTVSQFFSQSQEFRDRYGTLGDPEFVDLVYNNVLGRPRSQTGERSGSMSCPPDAVNRGSLMVGFSESPEFVGKTGTTPPVPATSFVEFDPAPSGVAAQQEKLNALFGPYGFPALAVDGDTGSLTRRALCAARVAMGLPVTRATMDPGGGEETALMALGSLPMPPGAPTNYGRWVLIEQTCQVMFVGEGSSRVAFVFPTSTGRADFPTRSQQASAVFRYDPAANNGGWHNSTQFPVAVDNPLNGNMYKPLYFDSGQAIHGALNVPTSPASHGCVRLRVGDQDRLVSWLGLQGASRPIQRTGDIGLVVRVVGRY